MLFHLEISCEEKELPPCSVPKRATIGTSQKGFSGFYAI